MEAGDDLLKGTGYSWLSGLEKLGDTAFASFEKLVKINLKTSRAWESKTTFESFWLQSHRDDAQAFFKKRKNRALRSRLAPFKQLARSLATSLPELLNYFDHRISNAMSEGFNSIASYRSRILFFCGKLDLKPA